MGAAMITRPALIAFALLAAPAYAGTPPAAGPVGLDRLAAVMPGLWKSTGETYSTQFTQAGKVDFITLRDCWREDADYRCVFVVNRKLQLFSIFTWNAADDVYHENQITVQGPSPAFNIMVKDNVWTSTQDGQDKQGKVYHYRKIRTYTSSSSVDFVSEYSLDGKTWVQLEKGVETRVDAGR
jgi:hypothetical protein